MVLEIRTSTHLASAPSIHQQYVPYELSNEFQGLPFGVRKGKRMEQMFWWHEFGHRSNAPSIFRARATERDADENSTY